MKITDAILDDYFTLERLNSKLEGSIVFAQSVLAGLEARLNMSQHPDLTMELSKQVSEWAELVLILKAKTPTDVNPKTMLNPAEEELCKENKRIQAIKLVRERLQNGLVDAKHLVDNACIVLGVPSFGTTLVAPPKEDRDEEIPF